MKSNLMIYKSKQNRRLESLLIVLCMFVHPVLLSAHDFVVNGIYYNYNSNGTSVSVTYKGDSYYSSAYSGNVVIPSEVTKNGKCYTVTAIGSCAFYNCSTLTSVTIGNGVTTIGESAFKECSNLVSVIIGENVQSIGNYAFEFCYSLTSLIIPNSVTSIGEYAFYMCSSLTTITIGQSITSIADGAFYNCEKLTYVLLNATIVDTWLQNITSQVSEITIGTNVNKIAKNAFNGKNNVHLKTLSLVPPVLESALPISSLEVPKGCTCDYALAENWNKMKKIYAIDNEEEYYPVVILNEGEKLVNIGGSERGCEIAANGSVIITTGNNERIQDEDCLVYTIHHNMTAELQEKGFYSYIVSPNLADNTIHTFSTDASHRCIANLNQSGTLLNYVGINRANDIYYLKVIGELNGTDMRVIGKMPNIRVLDMSEGQIVEGGQSYYGDNNYTKKDQIGEYFFAGQSQLMKVILPQTTTTIGKQTFLNKDRLIEICLPDGLTEIGENAFKGCNNLKSISLPKSISKMGANVFDGCNFEEVIIHCPVVGAWFKGMGTIKNLHFGDDVTTISNSAFDGCKGLTHVIIPEKTTSIGASSFANCSGLKRITIPVSMKSIGASAFAKCTNLLGVTTLNPVPPIIQSSTFDSQTRQTATLNVPMECSTAYWLAPYWGDFLNIKEVDATGIEGMSYTANPSLKQQIKVYTLSGQLIKTMDYSTQADLSRLLPSGLYIINGKKLLVK